MICSQSLLRTLLVVGVLHGAACSSTHEGLTIELRAASFYEADSSGVRPPPNPADTPRVFTTDNGTIVTLTRGYVVIESIELIACPTPIAQIHQTILPALARWISPVSVAHAHGRAGPTRFATPTVKRLLDEDETPIVLGTLGPPPATYCGADVVLGPADTDAVGLPSDVDLMEQTLLLEGTAEPPGGGSQPFSISAETHRVITLTFPTDIDLGGSVDAVAVEMGLSYDRWLDGIDFSTPPLSEQGSQALDNAAATTTAALANLEPTS